MHPLWVQKRLAGYLMELQDVSEVSRLTRSLKHRESELAMAHAELEKAHEELEAAHIELEARAEALEEAVETKARQLKEQHQQLVEAQKMESLGQLAGGISHDFNNVLFSLIGYADLIMAEPEDSEEVHYCAQKIKTGAERAAELTRKLLGFARRSKPQLREISIAELAEEVVSLLTRTVEPRVRLKLKAARDLPTVLGDPSQLHQVLMNVTLNAAEAIEGSGEIVVSLRGPVAGQELEGAAAEIRPELSYVILQVADTGSGMSAETRQRVFEPFYTTKSRGKGTGLGLSLVYGIVQEHGGAITVDSQLDEGTRFDIYLRVFAQTEQTKQGAAEMTEAVRAEAPLPKQAGRRARGDGKLASPRSVAATAAAAPSPKRRSKDVYKTFTGIETRTSKLGILVIDDNPEVLALCRRYFAEPLFEVWTATSGAEGAKILAEKTTEVDVILLDLIIPDGSPQEVFERLQSIKPNVTTVVMSGYHSDERVNDLMKLGAQKFLKKPFSRKDLRAAVRHIIEP
jgi:two-component system cell cycle sensor histidine kinase/response regulator CckA